jgi:hypothetical protein
MVFVFEICQTLIYGLIKIAIMKILLQLAILKTVYYLLDQYQKIRLNADHPISNERYEKIIEMIDYTLEKYKEAVNKENNIQQQQQNEYEEEEKELLIIINNIFNELEKKRKIARNKNDKDLLRDEIEIYRLEETTLDYILYIILEFAGKLI